MIKKRKLQDLLNTEDYLERERAAEQFVQDYLSGLPRNVFEDIIYKKLETENLLKLFQLSKTFSGLLEKIQIWQKLFKRDFPDLHNTYSPYIDEKISWRNMYFAVNLIHRLSLMKRSFRVGFKKDGIYYTSLSATFGKYKRFQLQVKYNWYPGNEGLFNEITLTAMLLFGTNMRIDGQILYEIPKKYDLEKLVFKLSILVARIFSLGFKSNINPDTVMPSDKSKYTIGSCVSCGKDSPKMKCCEKGLYCNSKCQKEDWSRHNKEHLFSL